MATEQDNFIAVDGDTARDRLVSALELDLLGPESATEVLSQSPNTRYLVGMLAPMGTALDPTEDERFDGEEADEEPEGLPPTSASLDPSSIGLSFAVDAQASVVSVRATWGEYAKVEKELDEEIHPDDVVQRDDEAEDGAGKRQRKGYEWRRAHHECENDLPVRPTDRLERKELSPGVEIHWVARALADAVVFSVFLVNAREAPHDKRPEDTDWVYQPTIEVTTKPAAIVARDSGATTPDADPDVASADLIYRLRRELATGHGVSADWQLADGAVDRAARAWTTMIPSRDVPIVSPAGAGVPPLSMDALGAADGNGLAELLQPLTAAYEKWILDRRDELSSIEEPHQQVARDHLSVATDSLGRMKDGIELLRINASARLAFNFANQAMALQLRQAALVKSIRRKEDPFGDIAPLWRPFQMGFILQCIASVADAEHPDREIADLLWFPTGGGKTEAYLGLTAFTLAHRRLRQDTDGLEAGAGTVVLMRYTLRLLTIQQFQRALTLLCACEQLRLADPGTWGSERFTIGLWVGQGATPNSYDESSEAIKDLRDDKRVYGGSPYQVLYCPWCGADLTPDQYTCEDALERTLVHCPTPTCEFSGANAEFGLPVLVVDEEIYRNPPSLLLATVDKFAQMPWNGRIQALFGRVERRCDRHGFLTSVERNHPATHRATKGYPVSNVRPCQRLAPPELIIQDELHLISGPLGTLVGIYELAVQALCGREAASNALRPKVIASTATIRRAKSQMEGLFGLDVAVFPPLGLQADRSFFAEPSNPAESPGRRYVGIYAPGKSVKTAIVRVYAALLSRAQVEYEGDPTPACDAYMTLVGYFNSLRELGGALRLVEDDVPARLRVLRRRGFGPARTLYETQELTSRIASSRIPDRLQQLDRTFATRETGAYPIDLLLASNMLSVGVDIDRLGLMVVSGQPKTSAEYIQATSRVGRKHPGLIVEVFNWIRPRDTSHYERFRHYHDTFYRHVEATSVTPFSARARDRALPAVLTSYVRLAEQASAPERGAGLFRHDNAAAQQISQIIAQRAFDATNRDDVLAETELQLRNLIDEWCGYAEDDDPELVYTRQGFGNPNTSPPRLNLLRPLEQRGGSGVWSAARSLREVEPEVDVVLREDNS